MRSRYKLLVVCLLILFASEKALASESVALAFPQFVNGEIDGQLNRSRIIIRNTGPAQIDGQVVFRRPDGGLLEVPIDGKQVESFEFEVSPFGTYEVVTDGTGALAVGAVETFSDSVLSPTL